MSSERSNMYLPGMEHLLASSDDIRSIALGTLPQYDTCSDERQSAFKKGVTMLSSAKLVVPGSVPKTPVDSWESLRRFTLLHIEHNIQANSTTMKPGYDPAALLNDADSGLETSIEFLKIIPQVLAYTDIQFDDPNSASYEYARNSASTPATWSRLNADGDILLTNVATSTNEDIEGDHGAFDCKQFMINDDFSKPTITFTANALQKAAGTHILKTQPSFGCPATTLVFRLYQDLAVAAYENNLFGSEYINALQITTATD